MLRLHYNPEIGWFTQEENDRVDIYESHLPTMIRYLQTRGDVIFTASALAELERRVS